MKGQAQYRPSFDMVERLQREVIQAKADAQAALHCQDHYYLRYQQQLFRLPKAEYLAAEQFEAEEQALCFAGRSDFSSVVWLLSTATSQSRFICNFAESSVNFTATFGW